MRNGRKLSSGSPHPQVTAIASQLAQAPAVAIAPGAAASAAPTCDSVHQFVQMVSAGTGIIDGIQADGVLIWYRNTGWQNVSGLAK